MCGLPNNMCQDVMRSRRVGIWSKENKVGKCFVLSCFQGSCVSFVGNSERSSVKYSCECSSTQVTK